MLHRRLWSGCLQESERDEHTHQPQAGDQEVHGTRDLERDHQHEELRVVQEGGRVCSGAGPVGALQEVHWNHWYIGGWVSSTRSMYIYTVLKPANCSGKPANGLISDVYDCI